MSTVSYEEAERRRAERETLIGDDGLAYVERVVSEAPPLNKRQAAIVRAALLPARTVEKVRAG